MMTQEMTHRSDAELWSKICERSVPAFEEIVRRHQSVVAAVAYNVCGDLALSEEVAQDAFLAAWRSAASLSDAAKLRSWLCGIARNLARNAVRKSASGDARRVDFESVGEPALNAPDAHAFAVSREEESLVWNALEDIPDAYREPLILFYREDQSVASVAQVLDLTEDAVRQRLSRGRDMLRQQVAVLVEGALRKSKPAAAFTMSVMAGIAALSVGTKTAAGAAAVGAAAAATGVAMAGGTQAGSKAAAAVIIGSGAAGVTGAIAGTAGGLLGGWLGSWIPAQMAPTRRERDLLLRCGTRVILVSLAMSFILALPSLANVRFSPAGQLMLVIGWMVVFQGYIVIEVIQQIRQVRRIRVETPSESDPNPSLLLQTTRQMASRFEGRVFTSRATWFGLPLMQFNVSDPESSPQTNGVHRAPARKVARGWIAVGDDARGILFAVGHRAKGLVAIGGRTIGVISVGGGAVGIIAIGGLSVGLLSIGGLGMGAIALGGGAIGWEACGGVALGWNFAAGGLAVAYDSAYGGGAIARSTAVGGAAMAASVNNEPNRIAIERHWMVRGMQWQIRHNLTFVVCNLAVVVLLNLMTMMLMYRRRKPTVSGTLLAGP